MTDDGSGRRFPDRLEPTFFAGLIEASTDPHVVVDLDGIIRWTNVAADKLLGDGDGAAVGRHMLEFLVPSSVEAASQAFAQYTRSDRPDTGWVGPPIPLDLQLGPDHVVPAEVRLIPTIDPSFAGAVIVLGVHAPETALYETIEQVIADAPLPEVMRSILRLIELESPYSVPVIGWEWDGQRFGSSVASVHAPTIDDDPLPAHLDGPTPWSLRIERDEAATDESLDDIDPALRHAAARRGLPACWVFPLNLPDGAGGERAEDPGDVSADAAVVVWRRTPGFPLLNISRRMERIIGLVRLALASHRSRRLLHVAARTDEVTGLANTRGLAEHLDELDHDGSGVVRGAIYCDLDHFKDVNDVHGHPVGDRSLKVVADRIRARVRGDDLVARVGGDEFVIVSTADTADEIGVLAERLVAAFADPISVRGRVLDIGLSAGWAASDPSDAEFVPSAQLVERADAALLRAKASGRNRVARG